MNIDSIRSILVRDGGEHLGDLVFWSLNDARVDRATLESLWASTGLDPGLLPEAPSIEKALKAAVRETQVGNPDRLLRLAKETEDEIVFVVVHEERPGDGSLQYSTEARLHLDRKRGLLHSDRFEHELVGAVRGRFETYRTTHLPDDVRRTIVKTLRSFAAVTLREGGGVYWVHAGFAEKLRHLQRTTEQIGSSRMFLLPLHRSAEAEQTLGELAKGSIEEELESLRTELAQFTAAPPERASTLIRRFDTFEALRAKARLYRDVLNVQVQDLDRQLDLMCSAVEELLNKKSKAA
jgi:hypothetical protein